MSTLGPRECITTYGTPAVATSGAIAGSTTPPLTSFTIRAPTASAASATAARVVSMLTTAPAPASARTTGSTRRRAVRRDAFARPERGHGEPGSLRRRRRGGGGRAARADGGGPGRRRRGGPDSPRT